MLPSAVQEPSRTVLTLPPMYVHDAVIGPDAHTHHDSTTHLLYTSPCSNTTYRHHNHQPHRNQPHFRTNTDHNHYHQRHPQHQHHTNITSTPLPPPPKLVLVIRLACSFGIIGLRLLYGARFSPWVLLC
jgi:hypothetical protein